MPRELRRARARVNVYKARFRARRVFFVRHTMALLAAAMVGSEVMIYLCHNPGLLLAGAAVAAT